MGSQQQHLVRTSNIVTLSLEVPRDYALLNTSVNVVDFEGAKGKVVSWADISHLDTPSDDDTLRRLPEPGR